MIEYLLCLYKPTKIHLECDVILYLTKPVNLDKITLDKGFDSFVLFENHYITTKNSKGEDQKTLVDSKIIENSI